jgi:hypoxanthine phosphoribosyltransferase
MHSIRLGDKTFVPYIPEEKIRETVKRLSDRISNDYQGQRPLFLVVLNGAFIFAADLVRGISAECDVSFVKLASYEGTSSTGKIKELVGLNENLEGRNIVVVEDIIDSGNTIEHILEQLKKMEPASVSVAAFLMKPDVFKKDFSIQYVGMEIPNDFIVGYGLDYDGLGRNLRDIYVIKEST